jgi:hypothetical protein
VIVHAGTRKHLDLVRVDDIVPKEEAGAILEDAAYAVKRRTLA